MKRIAAIAVSIIVFVFLVQGCANTPVEVSAATPDLIEVVVLEIEAPNFTPTPKLTPTVPPPTVAPTATPATTPSAANGTLQLTLEQLKQYNGKNGNPIYIAVDGVIYDVTNDHHWKTGTHEGYSGGKDLTDAIMNKSPHGISVLEGVPIVGKLVTG
ncbi:MAG: hypothetical protein C0413_03770 [Clostridiales bacterium]|nr:hypothetical protein [Clostridiales bacterium]